MTSERRGEGLEAISAGAEPRRSATTAAAPPFPSGATGAPAAGKPAPPLLAAPTLPKGGGALKGIGEKFKANPVTGTASLSVPIYTSPGRAGFGPQLSLSYDSGAGNGPFGLGWSLSVPSISRKTDKGLPRYADHEESDVFLLVGAEDLVPALRADGTRDAEARDWGADSFRIDRYRPRVEGLYARIERWTRLRDDDAHWRVTTKDNITSVYGASPQARIADPTDARRVYSWLLEWTWDGRGHVVSYRYKPEDLVNVDASAHEAHRLDGRTPITNRYLKRIRYGRATPFPVSLAAAPPLEVRPQPADLLPPADDGAEWHFEVVFDYGEHVGFEPTTTEDTEWPLRGDPFSSCRPGFEVRTARLCRRVLMFHRFPALGNEARLVRSAVFAYDERPFLTRLTSVTHQGHRWDVDLGAYEPDPPAWPPVELGYVEREPPRVSGDPYPVRFVDGAGLDNLPAGLETPGAQLVDLDGEGLPGLLIEQSGAWWYKRHLGTARDADGRATPRFGGLERVEGLPEGVALAAGDTLTDLDGDGRLDVVRHAQGDYAEHAEDGRWQARTPLDATPAIDWGDPDLRFVDLDGDGHADVLLARDEAFLWFQSRARGGYAPGAWVPWSGDEERGPRLVFHDRAEAIFVADFNGDGVADLVRVRNGEVCYWPGLGHGRFGAKVVMSGAPRFENDHAAFDPARLRVADLDGTGPADLIYLHAEGATFYCNESGNGWSAGTRLTGLPPVHTFRSVAVADLLANGTSCLVWSSSLPSDAARPLLYVDLFPQGKPHLLTTVVNNLGAETRLTYAPSTRFYTEDRDAGRPWATRLPFPVQVLERVEVVERITGTRRVTRYAYHNGYFDGPEREFRGFGMVEQRDAESFEALAAGASADPEAWAPLPPTLTRTWFHTGAFTMGATLEARFRAEYWPADLDALPAGAVPPPDLPETTLPDAPLDGTSLREACRALKGRVLRTEVYAEDGTDRAAHPYVVTEHAYRSRLLQPRGDRKHAVFDSCESEVMTLHYERDPTDPRIGHHLVLEVDDFGCVRFEADAVYPRAAVGRTDEQALRYLTVTEHRYAHRTDNPQGWRLGARVSQKSWEVTGLPPRDDRYTPDELLDVVRGLRELDFEQTPDPAFAQRRVLSWQATRYRTDDLAGVEDWGSVGLLALVDESYRLAFSPGRLDVYGEARLPAAGRPALLPTLGYVELAGHPGYWWVPSGRVLYSPVPPGDGVGFVEDAGFAAAHFFQPHAARDPFGTISRVEYDAFDLVLARHEDGARNVVAIAADYQALLPSSATDPNGNEVSAAIDGLGRVIRLASLGTPAAPSGDSLDAPTASFEYAQGAYHATGTDPVYVHTTLRERHGAENTGFQQSRLFTDGLGREAQKKAQAEPGEVDGVRVEERRIASGYVVFDNKGNPIRRFEPFFTATWNYDARPFGVASTLLYDPVGRAVATIHADHTWEKVRFSPWEQASYDRNDTVRVTDPRTDPDVGALFSAVQSGLFLPTWFATQSGGDDAMQDAATKAAAHADTPTRVGLDTLGRPVRTVQDNGALGEFESVVTLDIQGNAVAVRDARLRTIQTTDFDTLGRTLHQSSVDAGDRWVLPDIAGTPCHTWDSRGQTIRRTYDALRRPRGVFLGDALVEETRYGDDDTLPELADAAAHNQRGRVYRVRDGAGEVLHLDFDLDGNATRSTRQLAREYAVVIDWATLVAMEAEVYETNTSYDALGRVVEARTPAEPGRPSSRVVPTYNAAGLLETVEVFLRGAGVGTRYVRNIDYNARGQRVRVKHGNGSTTTYAYQDATFRLSLLETRRASDTAVIQRLTYTYDPVGNITRIDDGVADRIYYANAVVEPRREFTYDAIYRLIAATGREHPAQVAGPAPAWDTPTFNAPHPEDGGVMRAYREQYDYDAVGNIVRLIHDWTGPDGAAGVPGNRWTRAYTYGDAANNRLTGTQVGAQPQEAYTHDAHGNMTAMPQLLGMAWDFRDQLHRVDKGGGGLVYFTYDAAGQRVRKVWEKPGETVDRVYLGGFEIVRTRVGSQPREEWEALHVLDGQRRAALVETRTVGAARTLHRYQLDDHLGTACIELDEDAGIISYEEFHPCGSTAFHSVRSGEEVPRKRFRFTGMERDEETGLQYHSARYYAPWLGRWVSCDPIGLGDGPSLFVYAGCNPVRVVDPTGTEGTSVLYRDEALGSSATQDEVRSNALGHGVVYEGDATWDATDQIWTLSPEQLVSEEEITFYEFEEEVITAEGNLGEAEQSEPAEETSTADTVLDGVQIALDVAGLVPGWGEIADGANALISLGRGDYAGAALSAAAMIPFAGWFAVGGKWVRRGAHAVEAAGDVVKYADEAESVVLFSRRASFDPMPPEQFARIQEAFARQGKAIDNSEDALRYLEMRGAEGVTFNAETILVRPGASASTVFEELIHATQHRTGQFERWVGQYGNAGAEAMAEYQAASRLVRAQKAYGISDAEHLVNLARKDEFLQQLLNLGISP